MIVIDSLRGHGMRRGKSRTFGSFPHIRDTSSLPEGSGGVRLMLRRQGGVEDRLRLKGKNQGPVLIYKKGFCPILVDMGEFQA